MLQIGNTPAMLVGLAAIKNIQVGLPTSNVISL